MLRPLFESFYDGNIAPIANQLVKKNPDFRYISNMDGVYEEYLNQKTLLRAIIKSGDNQESILLDGHKVSACIACAIIKVRLITNRTINDDISTSAYTLDKAFRMNEQLAILSGLSCMFEYMAENKQNLYSDDNNKSSFNLVLPKTYYEDRSTYLDSLVRGIYYSNLFSNINPLLLSNIFFLIESYHRQGIELEKLRQSVS